jgi:hypothetical protein
MECPIHPLALPSGLSFPTLVTANPYSVLTVDILRLRHESGVLENGLADCVTYLHALRRKHARNERQLNIDPLPPRKKRKKIRQSNRELSKEIKNRERDEQAFLNNLRACKANLSMAEGISYTPTEFSSTAAECASSNTQNSFEGPGAAEFDWKGWADSLETSPFGQQCSPMVITKEIAPDEFVHEPENGIIAVRDVERPSLRRSATTDVLTSTRCQSSLSPVATVFAPTIDEGSYIVPPAPRHVDKLNDLSWLDTKMSEAVPARSKQADISTAMLYLAIQPRPEPRRRGSETCRNTSPQQSPCGGTASMSVGRDRTNSF